MIRGILVLACTLGLPLLAAAEEQPLMCFGTEPNWSVDLTEPGTARFATPDGESVHFGGGATRLDFLGETVWRGSPADGGDLVVWLQDAECSDTMSDALHPVAARVSLPDGRFLAGCCRIITAEAVAASLEGQTWRLTKISGTKPARLADLTQPVTVQFEAGQAQGFSGCNRFTGGYQLEGGRLKLASIAGTMMACPEPAMSVEAAFRQAFAGALQFSIDGDRLLVANSTGESLQFERQAPLRLDGSAWKVTGYNNNRQAVVGVLGASDITLSFADGEVSGSAGCNSFHGTYVVDSDRIQFGPARTTRMACKQPLMTQEQEFLAALASAVTWRIDGNVLDLHRADGERAIWAVSQ